MPAARLPREQLDSGFLFDREMTKDLGNIAEQTSRVALNFALADQSDQDLGLVAAEIDELCSLSGETGKRIDNTVDAVNADIANSLAITDQYVEQAGATVSESKQVIKRFRSTTNTPLESSSDLREESQAIGQEIPQVLVSQQLQSQVSQMRDMIRNNLVKLHLSFVQTDTLRRQSLTPNTAPHHSR